MLNDLSNAPSAVFDSLQIPVLLFSCDESSNIVLARLNQAAALCLALDAEQALGQTTEQVIDGAPGAEFQAKLREACDNNVSVSFKLEIRREHYKKQLNIDLCPAQIVNQRVNSIMATVTDISDRQAALAESAKMAHLVNDMESFMAHSAHELQDPIQHLSSLSKELKANFQDLGDGKLQLLDQVEDLCNDTLKLINNVLDRSRAINASVGSYRHIDFNSLCKDVFELFDPLGNHKLVADRVWLNGDARTLQLAMATLIENAIKHNAPQALSLRASISDNKETEMLLVTLEDNGKGFADPDKAFADKEKSKTAPGLCLMELKQMIKNAGGVIAVKSQNENSGAVISFSLPGSLS